jgi:hypothetical protein
MLINPRTRFTLRHERCRNPVPMLRALCHERAALTAKF